MRTVAPMEKDDKVGNGFDNLHLGAPSSPRAN